MIPFLNLELDNKLLEEIETQINNVVLSRTYILGPHLAILEKKFAQFIGVRHAVGVASGTDALRLSLRALGIVSGDKVLTVAFTSPFTALAIIEEGAIPVFCDVDERTLTIDVDDVERKIDKRTRAIMPVHLYGNPCDMTSLRKLARKFNLKIIEDACQAHGARFSGKRIGTFGDAAAFSFYPTKNLGAMGDAGMVVTNNRRVADMVRLLRHGGQTKRFWHKYRGINSRLDEIQAAVLEIKLRKLDSFNKKRVILAERYKKNLGDLPIKFQQSYQAAKPVYHLFVIRTKKRNALKRYLAKKGIVTDIYYPYPIHRQPAFSDFYDSGSLPVTEPVSREILALPLSPNLSFETQDKITHEIVEFFKRS